MGASNGAKLGGKSRLGWDVLRQLIGSVIAEPKACFDPSVNRGFAL